MKSSVTPSTTPLMSEAVEAAIGSMLPSLAEEVISQVTLAKEQSAGQHVEIDSNSPSNPEEEAPETATNGCFRQ